MLYPIDGILVHLLHIHLRIGIVVVFHLPDERNHLFADAGGLQNVDLQVSGGRGRLLGITTGSDRLVLIGGHGAQITALPAIDRLGLGTGHHLLFRLGDIGIIDALVGVLDDGEDDIRVLLVAFQTDPCELGSDFLEQIPLQQHIVGGNHIIEGLEFLPVHILIHTDFDIGRIGGTTVRPIGPPAGQGMETLRRHPGGYCACRHNLIFTLEGMAQTDGMGALALETTVQLTMMRVNPFLHIIQHHPVDRDNPGTDANQRRGRTEEVIFVFRRRIGQQAPDIFHGRFAVVVNPDAAVPINDIIRPSRAGADIHQMIRLGRFSSNTPSYRKNEDCQKKNQLFHRQ